MIAPDDGTAGSDATAGTPDAADPRRRTIPTPLGDVSALVETRGAGAPVVLMHGVFLDAALWSDVDDVLAGRPRVRLDMPAHGTSGDVGRDWHLDECTTMLVQVLDALGIDACVAVGHSWGAMVALRAGVAHPERFRALGLYNMPFRRATGVSRLALRAQKAMTAFPRFYARQAAKSLYSPEILRARPELSHRMEERLAARPAREIARTVDAVLLGARDASHLTRSLRVPALAVVGASDYVGAPPGIETVTVPGGHITPHEAPSETRRTLLRVLELDEPPTVAGPRASRGARS